MPRGARRYSLRMRPSETSVVPRSAGGPAALQERDPAYISRWLPYTWPLIASWFRPEVRGLERIPERDPVLLVGNHSGGNVAPDTLVFTLAFYRHFGVERPFFQLAHHLVVKAPWLSQLRKYGMIEATWLNAEAVRGRDAAERGRRRLSRERDQTAKDCLRQGRSSGGHMRYFLSPSSSSFGGPIALRSAACSGVGDGLRPDQR